MIKHINVSLQAVVLCSFAVLGASSVSAQGVTIPLVERVDAQPLLLITNRLSEAMQSIGAPFTKEQIETLNTLKNEPSDAKITASIQRTFDPMCIASIEISTDGKTTVTPGT